MALGTCHGRSRRVAREGDEYDDGGCTIDHGHGVLGRSQPSGRPLEDAHNHQFSRKIEDGPVLVGVLRVEYGCPPLFPLHYLFAYHWLAG